MNTREAISALALHHLSHAELLALASQSYIEAGGMEEPGWDNAFLRTATAALTKAATV